MRWDGDPFTVIGVVKDLIMESPYSQVLPAVFTLSSNLPGFLLARINPSASPHAAVEWWIFLVAGACALGATLFTVSYQAIRTARANPIKALRTE